MTLPTVESPEKPDWTRVGEPKHLIGWTLSPKKPDCLCPSNPDQSDFSKDFLGSSQDRTVLFWSM